MDIPLRTLLSDSPLSILKQITSLSVDDYYNRSSRTDDNFRSTIQKINDIISTFTGFSWIFSIGAIVGMPLLFHIGIITSTTAIVLSITQLFITAYMSVTNTKLANKKDQLNKLFTKFYVHIYNPITWTKAAINGMKSFERAILLAEEEVPKSTKK